MSIDLDIRISKIPTGETMFLCHISIGGDRFMENISAHHYVSIILTFSVFKTLRSIFENLTFLLIVSNFVGRNRDLCMA